MTQVYVVKTVDDDTGEPIPGVFEELAAGRSRIAWSYLDHLDLRMIQEKINTLDKDEQKAKRCLRFLTKPTLDDYLLYPHQPERYRFCVVQVKGEYDYSSEEDGLNGDFRSFRPCSLITSVPVDWYDEIVPSQLRVRLGKPGRFSQVYETAPFFGFLDDLPEAGSIQDDSNRASLRRIHRELRKELPDALRREFTAQDLSRKFCPDLFDRMGYSYIVREGPDERGSDVVVTVGDPLLPDSVEVTIGVQVFASKGSVEEWYFREKLDQLLEGWDYNSLDYGALLTTGEFSEESKEALRRHNKDSPKRLVRLIDGDELADLFLEYFPPGEE